MSGEKEEKFKKGAKARKETSTSGLLSLSVSVCPGQRGTERVMRE